MHPKDDTIAKFPELEMHWFLTNDLNWAGTDVEAWSKSKEDKWKTYLDKLSREGNWFCYMNFSYSGYKDADKGTTRRDFKLHKGDCFKDDIEFPLQGWDIESGVIAENGKSVVIGLSRDMDVAPRIKEDEAYVFAVSLHDMGKETEETNHDYYSVPTLILLGGMSLAAAGAVTLATLLTF